MKNPLLKKKSASLPGVEHTLLSLTAWSWDSAAVVLSRHTARANMAGERSLNTTFKSGSMEFCPYLAILPTEQQPLSDLVFGLCSYT